jgi:cysteine desulfurase
MLIYLDNHATTQPSPRVVAAVCDAMRCCGNAASSHAPGRAMADRVARARRQVAAVVGADPSLVIFTSGATEANNLAIRGVIDACARGRNGRNRLLVSAVEHSSVLSTAKALEAQGRAVVTVLPVDATGAVAPATLARALGRDVALVSIMVANNEVGTLNDVEALSALCRQAGVLYHADACQSFAKIALRPGAVDLLSTSAHKLRGPTGIGALIVSNDALRRWITPQQTGGTQEDDVRAGTTNSHGIIGFGEAAEETATAWRAPADRNEGMRLAQLRCLLWSELQHGVGSEWIRLNGATDGQRRLPQNLNVTLIGVCPISLDEAVRERVAVSGAAACRSLGGERSHVLEAMNVPDDGAVVRFGLGGENDEAQIRFVARLFTDAALRLRGAGCPIPSR